MVGVEQPANAVHVVTAVGSAAVEPLLRQPSDRGGGRLGRRCGNETPGRHVDAGAGGQSEVGGFAQALLVAQRQQRGGELHQPRRQAGARTQGNPVCTVPRQPDLRLGAGAGRAGRARQRSRHRVRLVVRVLEQRLGFSTELGDGDFAAGGHCVTRRRRVFQGAHAARAHKGQAIQAGDLAGHHAVLPQHAIHHPHSPAIGQRVREHAEQTAVRRLRGPVQLAIEGEREGRQVRPLAQVVRRVLEEDALAVLRQLTRQNTLAGTEASEHVEPARWRDGVHCASTSSMLRGRGGRSAASAANPAKSSTHCHRRRNCRSEISPVVSKRLMVEAGTVLRPASAARESP